MGYLKSNQDQKEFELLFNTLSEAQKDQLRQWDFFWTLFYGKRPHKYKYMAWRLKVLKEYINQLSKRYENN